MRTLLSLFLFLCTAALGQTGLPLHYKVMEESTSPDGKLAVLEPQAELMADGEFEKSVNQIITMPAQTVVGAIQGAPGMKQMNHGGASATWSEDSRLLLWHVEGKWGPRAVAFVALNESAITKQVDLLGLAQAELLKRSKEAHPKTYAAAVKQNAGSGSALPEGFTTSLVLQELSAKLPVNFVITMTSNPKGIENYPAKAELQAFLFGTVNEKMEITWGDFGAYDSKAGERLTKDCEAISDELGRQLEAVTQTLSASEGKKLMTEEDAWEKKLGEIEEAWFMQSGLCPMLSFQQRQVLVGARIKYLARKMENKENKGKVESKAKSKKK